MRGMRTIRAKEWARDAAALPFSLGYALYLAFGYTLFHPTTLFSAADGNVGEQMEFCFLIAIVSTITAVSGFGDIRSCGVILSI